MFAITTSPTWLARTDEFKKVGKKIQKQRQTEVDRIKDKIGDIAREERKRVQEIFKEHRDILKKDKEARKSRSKKAKSIDLYEK